MANRNFPNGGKLYTFHTMPVAIDCNITIGSSGAVSSFSGSGIQSVTRLKAGVYQIQMQDNYSKVYSVIGSVQSPATGSAIADGSLVAGTLYQIVSVGTSDFKASGLNANLIPAAGQSFVATGVGGAGTGTVKAVGVSGISSVEVVNNPSSMSSPSPAPNLGAIILVQCLAPTSSSVTTAIPANPASGSVVSLVMLMSNSSIKG